MKWIMIIMICWGTECSTMYEQFLYENENDCLTEAAIVSDYAQMTYPGSTGQIYCLNENEFQKWMDSTAPQA